MTESPKIPVKAVLEAVGSHFGVGARDMLSRSKLSSVTLPRQIVYYLAVRLVSHKSSTSIARELQRDHSTLIHGRDKIRQMIVDEPTLGLVVSSLEEKLRNGKYTSSRASVAALSKSFIAAQQARNVLQPEIQELDDRGGLDDKTREIPESQWPI